MQHVVRRVLTLQALRLKNDEATAVFELAEVYSDKSNRLSQLPIALLALHIIPYIHNNDDREIHARAIMYLEYLLVSNDVLKQKNYIYDIKNKQHKAIWYGKQIELKLKRMEIPEFLQNAVLFDNFYFTNTECKLFLKYMINILQYEGVGRGLNISNYSSLANKKFRHEFSWHQRRKVIVNDKGITSLIVIITIFVSVIVILLMASVILIPVYHNHLLTYATQHLFLIPDGKSLVWNKSAWDNASSDERIKFKGLEKAYENVVNLQNFTCLSFGGLFVLSSSLIYLYWCCNTRYTRQARDLGESFDIHVMVKNLCNDLEKMSTEAPFALSMHENNRIPNLINMHGFDEMVKKNALHLNNSDSDWKRKNKSKHTLT